MKRKFISLGAGIWAQKADMPTARWVTGSTVVDEKIYVIGGNPVATSGEATAAVEEYDPATDTWTRRADMSNARDGVRAAAVDGIIYVIGGWDRIKSVPAVEAYDPATDTWTRKADMPTARRMAAGCLIDGRIHVSGGYTTGDVPEAIVATVEVYDPATDTWTQASDMPWRRNHHTASVVDGRMYIIGGCSGIPADAGAFFMSPVVDVYDPATDMWTTAADFPTPRWDFTASVVDGKIYVIGGRVGEVADLPNLSPVSTVEEFDPGLSGTSQR